MLCSVQWQKRQSPFVSFVRFLLFPKYQGDIFARSPSINYSSDCRSYEVMSYENCDVMFMCHFPS